MQIVMSTIAVGIVGGDTPNASRTGTTPAHAISQDTMKFNAPSVANVETLLIAFNLLRVNCSGSQALLARILPLDSATVHQRC